MITVTNRYAQKDFAPKRTYYCGRGTPLGNPEEMKHFRSALLRSKERNRVCDLYATHLPKLLLRDTPEGHKALGMIQKIHASALTGDVFLECFCAPLRCHCDTIKTVVEDRIKFNEAN